jgi:hypothetical protein
MSAIQIEPRKAGRWTRRLLLMALTLLVLVSLLDPADEILHLKVPAFAAVVLIWLARSGLTRKTVSLRLWILTATFSIALPVIFTIIGELNHDAHSGGAPLALFKSFLFLLLVPVLVSEDIDLAALLIRLGIVVALITLIMVAINFVSPTVFLIIYQFTLDKQNATISQSRDALGIGLGQFYYRTCPLMIFPFTYYSRRLIEPGHGRWRALFMTMIYGAAFLSSGARANVFVSLLVFGVLLLMRVRRSMGWQAAMAIAAAGILVASATIVPRALDTSEKSNAIKLGHVRSYEEDLNTRWTALLWGEGADSAFYSEGFQNWTTVSELTYVEMVRLFGIPVTIAIIAALAWIGYLLIARGAWTLAIAYVGYLVISASNPLLISSTGLLALCAVWKETVAPSCPCSALWLPIDEIDKAQEFVAVTQ